MRMRQEDSFSKYSRALNTLTFTKSHIEIWSQKIYF